jgi:hypothetical protein
VVLIINREGEFQIFLHGFRFRQSLGKGSKFAAQFFGTGREMRASPRAISFIENVTEALTDLVT